MILYPALVIVAIVSTAILVWQFYRGDLLEDLPPLSDEWEAPAMTAAAMDETYTDLVQEQHDKIAELQRDWLIFARAINHMTWRETNPLRHVGSIGFNACPGCINVQTAQGLANHSERAGEG